MKKHFSTKGGFFELPGRDAFAFVDMWQPQWYEPKPHLTGLKLWLFLWARKQCQKQDIWFSTRWVSQFYREHGYPPLKPHQVYMHYRKIFYCGQLPDWHYRLMNPPHKG